MFASVSTWGWLLGGLSAIVVGIIWYSPFLFGKEWGKAMGVTEAAMAKGRAKVVPVLLLISFLTAYILAQFIVYFQNYTGDSWITSGVYVSLLAFAGLAGTALVAHTVFDPRPKSALFINLGNRLVTLLAMGLIIGAFQK
jgi:hypothetical protein